MSPIDLPEPDPNPPPQFHPLLPRLLVLNGINIFLSIIYFFYMMRVLSPESPLGFQLTTTQHSMLIGWCGILFFLGGYAFILCLRLVLYGNITERIVAPYFTLLSLPALTLSPMALVHILTL